jgi:hypothetical protein
MDADGFTMNVADGPLEGLRRGWFAIKGGLNAAGVFGTSGAHTGYGFPVGAGVWVSTDIGTVNAAVLNYAYSICFSDGHGGRGAVAHRTFQAAFRGSAYDFYIPDTFSNVIADAGNILPVVDGFNASAAVGGGFTGEALIFWANPGTLLEVRASFDLATIGVTVI